MGIKNRLQKISISPATSASSASARASLKNRLKRIFIAPDFILAFIGAALFAFLMIGPASAETVKEISSLAVTTLSIIFSVFFAALAVLITSADNEFVIFLEKNNWYTEIVWSFKFTFLIIFIALLFSIIMYVSALFELAKLIPGVYPWFILFPYAFVSLYALFGTVLSTVDAIKYAERRTKFLLVTNQKKTE